MGEVVIDTSDEGFGNTLRAYNIATMSAPGGLDIVGMMNRWIYGETTADDRRELEAEMRAVFAREQAALTRPPRKCDQCDKLSIDPSLPLCEDHLPQFVQWCKDQEASNE